MTTQFVLSTPSKMPLHLLTATHLRVEVMWCVNFFSSLFPAHLCSQIWLTLWGNVTKMLPLLLRLSDSPRSHTLTPPHSYLPFYRRVGTCYIHNGNVGVQYIEIESANLLYQWNLGGNLLDTSHHAVLVADASHNLKVSGYLAKSPPWWKSLSQFVHDAWTSSEKENNQHSRADSLLSQRNDKYLISFC